MNNPLKTRSDLGSLLVDLMEPLKKHSVPGGLHLGDTAAHYPPRTAVMEGWSRCLWGIGPFAAGGGKWPDKPGFSYMDELLAVLTIGVDPKSEAYWGECGSRDQRLVEMASIAMCLLIAPDVFWKPLSVTARQNLYTWLSQIERCELPPTNWCYFRLLVCAAFRSLGLPVDEEAEREAFKTVESCYRGDGWYQDGREGAFDSYNPMGFHFYNLVLAAFAKQRGDSSEQHKTSMERAKEFGSRFAAWFHHDGSIIPYGRSLSYRFAAVSFFSACAFAGLEVIPWGEMKGIVLRHLRYWFSKPILDKAGILSIGYSYPNLIMADAYNSPGSPYWGFKAFLILALGDDHPFWQAEELPLPSGVICISEKTAGFIVNRSAEDTQLLTGSVYPPGDMNHAAQKYGKIAYSARFGFCVSHSNYGVEKCGCDSTLLLSEEGHYWRERREILEMETGEDRIKFRWQPWSDVDIVTILIRLGDWHIRIHKIESRRRLHTIEGGFAVSCLDGEDHAKTLESRTGKKEALIAYPSAASRIAALERDTGAAARTGRLIKPAPNLNIIHPLVIVPVLEGIIESGSSILATAVRAGDSDKVRTEAVPDINHYLQE